MNITKLSASILSWIYKVFLVIILALPLNGFSQSVIYVKYDAGGSDNGSSWTDAFLSLQSALDAAIKGDSIWVAAGTYKPSTDKDGNPPPEDNRTPKPSNWLIASSYMAVLPERKQILRIGTGKRMKLS